jgi:hypothetical protein
VASDAAVVQHELPAPDTADGNTAGGIAHHRERILADGSLQIASSAYARQQVQREKGRDAPEPFLEQQQQQQQEHPQQRQRPPGLAAAAPIAAPLPQERLEELVDLIVNSR